MHGARWKWKEHCSRLSVALRLTAQLAWRLQLTRRPRRFILQPDNGLPVSSFRGEAQDSHLLRCVLPTLYALVDAADVRPLLATRYSMRAWFQSKGLMDAADDETADSAACVSAHESASELPALLEELDEA